MRKTYIGWWVASAWFLCICVKAAYDYIFFPSDGDAAGYPVLALFALLTIAFFYIGYRRFKEYEEYQEDRKIRNEFLKSNTKRPDEKLE
jgi:hypothetical protein